MSNKGRAGVLALAAAIFLIPPSPSGAVDEEGCRFCHGLELRSPATQRDGRDLRVWEPAGGSHDGLFCSDCHVDARRAPHAATPGPAQCIGECHGRTADAGESHRRASYGGLTETHRGFSSPGAPCRLCHRATDKPERPGTIPERCAACHPDERNSEIRGVHGRLAGMRGVALCAACHPAHPSGTGKGKATCGASGCHKAVTAGMRRLVGHRGTITGGRASEAGLLIGIAALGWIVGRRLSPSGRTGGVAG